MQADTDDNTSTYRWETYKTKFSAERRLASLTA